MILEHKNFPYKFDANKCNSCEGNCCIGESGYIWITKTEIEALAKHLGISYDETMSKYVTKISYKYSLKENKLNHDNYACVFFDLEKKCCSIYEVRPNQCRTFPFWTYFKDNIEELKQECPAILH